VQSTRDSYAQRQLDAGLPSFLVADHPDRCAGTRWMVDADLACVPGIRESVGGRQAEVLVISSTWPPITYGEREVAVRVPAGTVARFVGTSFEIWGVGYLASLWLDRVVDGGPLDGKVLVANDEDRWLVTGSVSHRTAAIQHLIPA
jgi:hypothetical protein